MDLADAIEETRRLKRALCYEAVGLTPDDVFGGDFLDWEHLCSLRQRLERHLASTSHPRGRELLGAMERLEGILAGDLVAPPEEDLCRRYSDGLLDARTVIQITGWSVDDLYETCCRMGLSPAL